MSILAGCASAEIAAETGIALAPYARFVLESANGRLQLRDTSPNAPGPLWVDLLSPQLESRRRAGRGLLLARACGVRKGKPLPRIFDATAGLGRDAYTLAALGCEVVATERSAVVHALLCDGLARARAAGDAAAGRIQLLQGSAGKHLHTGLAADTVLVDPMFPQDDRTALSRKEMQYFQALLGPDSDEHELFQAAIASSVRRVVVKRPRIAPVIDPGRQVDVTFEGKSVRFDVYLQ